MKLSAMHSLICCLLKLFSGRI
ncbi:hypothetical protein BIW11_03249 [Tropilaelaps mercedesae]|uniref:Uncharacterized protein n=1 Tax=Tropilaelaps mercedesae TaxID=418985 RepID=A0A1V9XPU3_9ACAR|nr:hypothetical protein BIW11_03249 [Tropilaelaps mercedesae]